MVNLSQKCASSIYFSTKVRQLVYFPQKFASSFNFHRSSPTRFIFSNKCAYTVSLRKVRQFVLLFPKRVLIRCVSLKKFTDTLYFPQKCADSFYFFQKMRRLDGLFQSSAPTHFILSKKSRSAPTCFLSRKSGPTRFIYSKKCTDMFLCQKCTNLDFLQKCAYMNCFLKNCADFRHSCPLSFWKTKCTANAPDAKVTRVPAANPGLKPPVRPGRTE